MEKKDVKKIIVRVPNWIGDAVMCLPALEALHGLFPGADITVLARPVVVPVFENNPAVGEIMVYEKKGRHRGLMGRITLAKEIRDRGFDQAVLFQNAFDAALLVFMAGVPETVGYARDMRSPLLTKPVPVTEEVRKAHHVRYYLNLVGTLGEVGPDEPSPRLFLTEEEKARAGEFLKERGLTGKPLVGAAPGASYGPAKMWPAEGFARVLDGLADEFGATALVFGGEDDREAAEEVSKLLDCEHLDLAGRIGLREFMALASRLGVFVTNDSGPMHVSYALGVPTVAVFGSTDSVATGPLGGSSTVVRREFECSPCLERECRYGHYECLTSVAPEEVLRSAVRLMKLRSQGT